MNLAELIANRQASEDVDVFAGVLGWQPADFGDGFYDRSSGAGDPMPLNGYVLSRLKTTLQSLTSEQLPGNDLQLVGMLEVPNASLAQTMSLWVMETDQGRFQFTDVQEETNGVARFCTSEEVLQSFVEFNQHLQWCASEARQLLST